MSRIRFNPKIIQRVVEWMAASTKVFVVNVNWNRDNAKWNVNAWKLDENGQWSEGNRVLSRNHMFLPLSRGSFCLYALLPSPEHSTSFFKWVGNFKKEFKINPPYKTLHVI